MARGKTVSPEMIYKTLASYAITNNCRQTAQQLQMYPRTVEKIVKANKDKPEYTQLFAEKKDEFVAKTTEIIDMMLDALRRKVKMMQDDGTLTSTKVTEITTALGTLYDKRALALGDSTDNTKVIIKLGDADEYGG